ncbi:MAG: rhodanese-like domain-containing protein [Pseudomonadota bacterium]
MTTPDIVEILERAAARAQAAGRPYAGDLTPQEAFALWNALPGCKLIDVRTQPELEFVGYVPNSLQVIWQLYPDMQVNPRFAEEVASQARPEEHLLFLCRTGGRSAAAAAFMTERGYRNCFNVLEGFEGRKDAQGHRGTVEGWKVAGLPWMNK